MEISYKISQYGCSDVGIEGPNNGFATVRGESYRKNHNMYNASDYPPNENPEMPQRKLLESLLKKKPN